MIELCCHTKDGVKLRSCENVTLYREGGYPFSGMVNHFGHEDGYHLTIDGPAISALYHSRLRSLEAARESLLRQLTKLETEIANEHQTTAAES